VRDWWNSDDGIIREAYQVVVGRPGRALYANVSWIGAKWLADLTFYGNMPRPLLVLMESSRKWDGLVLGALLDEALVTS